MMIGIIVFLAEEHEPAAAQLVDQCGAIDELICSHIPDPPQQGMALPKRRLPSVPRFSGVYRGEEKHAKTEPERRTKGPTIASSPQAG